jgi:hypothetical protein
MCSASDHLIPLGDDKILEVGRESLGGFEFLWACGPPIGMKVHF